MARTSACLLMLLLTCTVLSLAGCESASYDNDAESSDTTSTSSTPPASQPAAAEDAENTPDADEGPDTDDSTVYIRMETSMGDIYLALNREKAPISTANFLNYTEKQFYDGTVFHRVMKGFMIQGGGLTADLVKKPADLAIKNESGNGLTNVRGSIAMARTSAPDSATAQFFINVVDNPSLDGPQVDATGRPTPGAVGYAVFGEVVGGMDVVDAIRNVQTHTARTPQGPRQNVPIEPVIIETVRRITADEAIGDE